MNMKNKASGLSRRDFIKTTAAMSAAMAVGSKVYAAGEEKFKVALIGCGGRGNGALSDCHEAAKVLGIEVELVATADAFKDRAVDAGKKYGLAVAGWQGGCVADFPFVLFCRHVRKRSVGKRQGDPRSRALLPWRGSWAGMMRGKCG